MKIRSGILLLAILTLSSCTPSYIYYIRNLLNQNVQVSLVFSKEEETDRWLSFREYLPARHDLSGPDDFRTGRKLLRDSIRVKKIDKLTVQFSIPPNSVVQYGNPYYFEEIRMEAPAYNKTMKGTRSEMRLYDNLQGKDEGTKAVFKAKNLRRYNFFDIK